jgi:hypothetical protein
MEIDLCDPYTPFHGVKTPAELLILLLTVSKYERQFKTSVEKSKSFLLLFNMRKIDLWHK